MHPMTMIPLIAFVTLIKGVCKDGETSQITMNPIIQASVNTKILNKRAWSFWVTSPIKTATIKTGKATNNEYKYGGIGISSCTVLTFFSSCLIYGGAFLPL